MSAKNLPLLDESADEKETMRKLVLETLKKLPPMGMLPPQAASAIARGLHQRVFLVGALDAAPMILINDIGTALMRLDRGDLDSAAAGIAEHLHKNGWRCHG